MKPRIQIREYRQGLYKVLKRVILMKNYKYRAIEAAGRRGFTLIELMVVLVIMAIAAAIAVPMFSGAGTIEVEAAGHVVAADLEYARSLAISRQQTYSVVFDAAGESYQVEDSSSAGVNLTLTVNGQTSITVTPQQAASNYITVSNAANDGIA